MMDQKLINSDNQYLSELFGAWILLTLRWSILSVGNFWSCVAFSLCHLSPLLLRQWCNFSVCTVDGNMSGSNFILISVYLRNLRIFSRSWLFLTFGLNSQRKVALLLRNVIMNSSHPMKSSHFQWTWNVNPTILNSIRPPNTQWRQ